MNVDFNPLAQKRTMVPKRQVFGIVPLLFSVLFGAAFAGISLLVIGGSGATDSTWEKTSGTVVDTSKRTASDGSTLHAAVVEYTVDGKSYQTVSNLSSSVAPKVGEDRDVAYNPIQPSQSQVTESIGSMWLFWLFPLFGVVIMVVSIVSFTKSLKRSRDIKQLLQTGQRVQGVLTDIQSSDTRSSGTYKITVTATSADDSVQHYTSDSIVAGGNLAMIDFHNNPVLIGVYVDSTNPRNYYVDISDIPDIAPQRVRDLIGQATVKNTQSQATPDDDNFNSPTSSSDTTPPPLFK